MSGSTTGRDALTALRMFGDIAIIHGATIYTTAEDRAARAGEAHRPFWNLHN